MTEAAGFPHPRALIFILCRAQLRTAESWPAMAQLLQHSRQLHMAKLTQTPALFPFNSPCRFFSGSRDLQNACRHAHKCPELGAGVLGQIKNRALPAAFDVTEVHRGTPTGPALCRAVLGVQNNQHRKTKASRKRPGLHQAVDARCRLVLVGQVPRGQVALVIRGVLRVFGPRSCKWAQKIAAPRRFPLHPV